MKRLPAYRLAIIDLSLFMRMGWPLIHRFMLLKISIRYLMLCMIHSPIYKNWS